MTTWSLTILVKEEFGSKGEFISLGFIISSTMYSLVRQQAVQPQLSHEPGFS